MKKIFLVLLILFLSVNACFAQCEKPQSGDITFVYMNGSNSNSDASKEAFLNDVKNFHPHMKEAFESNAYDCKHFLKECAYSINPQPIAFYWGDKSKDEVSKLDRELMFASIFSPKIAQTIRSFFAHCMHDAIWVQKPHNMNLIINDLHKVVKSEEAAGNKVVLVGYSAGSFITFQYIFKKFPFITDPYKIFRRSQISQENKDFIKNTSIKPTCIDALVDLDLVVIGADGRVVPIENERLLKERYLKINEQTKLSCSSASTVNGVINFGSPFLLFYSDLSDTSFDLNVYNKLLYKYIIENDFFWLTTNYREDPLGFPSATKLNVDAIARILSFEISPRVGFIFDRSDLRSKKTFAGAHLAYWKNAKKLAKDIAQTYEMGRKYYYGDK